MAPQSLWYWGLCSASSVQNSLQTKTTTTNLCLGLLILEIYQSQGPVLEFWCRRVSVGFSLSRYYFSKSFLWEPQAPWNDTSPVEMAVVSEGGLVGSQSRSAAERLQSQETTGFLNFIPKEIAFYDLLIHIFKQSLSLYTVETTKAHSRVGLSSLSHSGSQSQYGGIGGRELGSHCNVTLCSVLTDMP